MYKTNWLTLQAWIIKRQNEGCVAITINEILAVMVSIETVEKDAVIQYQALMRQRYNA